MNRQVPLKILVTGGSGFIGSHLCAQLLKDGHSVTILDLRHTRVSAIASSISTATSIVGDVRDHATLDPLVRSSDVVFHFAATVSVPLCQNDPMESYSNNFQATLGVLESIRRARNGGSQTRLVFASTAAVYGDLGNDMRSLVESQVATTFFSFYAAQKHACEQAISLYQATHGVPALTFRFFNVYGYGQDPASPYSGVISVFSDLAKRGLPLPCNGGGHQTRDFIHVDDLIHACVSALTIPISQWKGEPTNLGTGKSVTVLALADTITRLTGTHSRPVSAPPREGDVLHSKAHVARAQQLLNFTPSMSLEAGLEKLLSELKGS
jgi:UDP-glucose 4-epimerase